MTVINGLFIIYCNYWYRLSYRLVAGCYTRYGGIRHRSDGRELNVVKLLDAISYAIYIYVMTMEKFILKILASIKKNQEQPRCLLDLVATSLLPTVRGKFPPVARPHDTLVGKLHRVLT
jgi:hypothetical protein